MSNGIFFHNDCWNNGHNNHNNTFKSSNIILHLMFGINQKTKITKKLKNKTIYGGFWVRMLAGIIDFVILWVIYLILLFIPIFGWIIGLFASWLYFAVQHSSSKQATLGMRALDLKIADENLNKISFWRASGNYFVSYISGLILFIGFLMIAFTKRKQGLHNLVSRTVFLRAK